jgi:metallo-beta-lactamase family protein
MKAALPDRKNGILFVGYQAAGTRGRRLVEGAPQVKIHGQMVPVAARVAKIDSMSAHADRNEIVRWLETFPSAPSRVCLVHGEPDAMEALNGLIRDRLKWRAHMPAHGETLDL